MTRESAIVASIRAALKAKYGTRWYGIKVHCDQYLRSEPDLLGCLNGRCVAIECKVPGKHSRPDQLAAQRKWRRAGAIVIEDATSAAQVLAEIERVSKTHSKNP